MRRKVASIAMLVSGTAMAAGLAGCTDDAKDWQESDAANGRINMDEVKAAFEKSNSITAFEERLNQIYDGDNAILVQVIADKTGTERVLKAYEDLDNNKTIDPAKDDLLFSVIIDKDTFKIQGAGANSYYNDRGHTGGVAFYPWFIHTGGYYTSPVRVIEIERSMQSYRNTPSYESQQTRNSEYFGKAKTAHPEAFGSTKLSSTRTGYQSTKVSSIRSGSGFSGSSSFGGFKGGS